MDVFVDWSSDVIMDFTGIARSRFRRTRREGGNGGSKISVTCTESCKDKTSQTGSPETAKTPKSKNP